MTHPDTPKGPTSPESQDAETSYTSCDALHQYHGDTYCGSACTLEFPHGSALHVCGNGHSF